jgi:hypothetical protein
MSLSLVEVNAYTNRYIVKKSTDVIYKNSPVFTRLHTRNAERFPGGLYIQRPIIFAELNGSTFTKGSVFDISFVNTDTAFTENIKGYYVNISLYGFDDILNRGPEAAFSQVETKMLNASMKMAKLLAVDMYNDGGNTRSAGTNSSTTQALDGFEAWVDDGTNVSAVGGITRTDLAPNGVISGANAYTLYNVNTWQLSTIQTAYGNAWFGADHVDLICATQAGWNQFWNSIQPLQRYLDTESDVGKIGFQSFRFNAAEVVIDKYMPGLGSGTPGATTNFMYGLNTNYVEWYHSDNPRFQFGFTGFKEAQNTIDVSGQFLWAGNILVPNPRTCFKLNGTAL